jgi:hypothetical protein
MDEIKDFQTTDLILASTLATLQYPLKRLEPFGERYAFVFAGGNSIGDIVSQFNSEKILVEPKKFTYHYRTIKRKIFDLITVQKGEQGESII